MTSEPGAEADAGLPDVRPDPAAIDRILHAYRESQVLITATRLGLFDALRPGVPTPLPDMAAAAGITGEAGGVLCDALEGLGLLVARDGGYVAGPLAAAHLTLGAPYPLREWVASEQDKYVGFAGLADALRAEPEPEDAVRRERRRSGLPPEEMRGLAEVAHARSAETARVVTALVEDLGGRPGRILDAGGGHGMDAIAVLAELPGWTAVVADRGGPLALARANTRRYGVADRVTTYELDLEADDLSARTGGGFDVAFLFMVLGGKPAPEALAVARRMYAAVRPGGWLLVRGNWTDPLRAATSALKHMLRPGGRRTLTRETLIGLLAEAGFVDVHTVAREDVAPNAIVAARRPA